MRITLVAALLLSLQSTLAIADENVTPKVQNVHQRIFEIDLKVLLNAYETLSTMISETQIELALLNGDDDRAEAERKVVTSRLQNLSSLKEKVLGQAIDLQKKINVIADTERDETSRLGEQIAEPSNAPKYSKTSFDNGGSFARTR